MVASIQRKYSKDGSPHVTNEKFNTASHLAASIFALLGTVLLIVSAAETGKPWQIVSFSIYGLSLFGLFIASTLHHGIDGSKRLEERLRSFDYFAIFLLIAGTFTPICLVLLRGIFGWSVFAVIWTVAIAGILFKALWPRAPKWLFLTFFGAMGWMGAVAVYPIYQSLSWPAITLLVLGGIFYTGGAVIFTQEKPNPLPGFFGFHEIWHITVIFGALTHFLLMYFYVLPF